MRNRQTIERIAGWREKYPAFEKCAAQGEGWYLPAIGELEKLLLNDAVHEAVNRTLERRGGEKLFDKGEWLYYWSSSEKSEKSAWYISMRYGRSGGRYKYYDHYVRAVSAF